MAGLIRRSDIDEVRSRTNLADIVGDYVTLKSAGVGSMKGLCPFHDERSPSFHVRPQVGFYHCFGCGEGGDVFTFLQKMDHVTFSEAVERLAGRLGYELHYEDGGPAADQGNRSRLLAANAAAEAFFREQLGTPAAEPARQFLGERGFDSHAAERFSIGFAPNSYDALGDHLRALGVTAEELLASGLQGQGDRKPYDRFRGRLIWPIKDVTGQTLGFGARYTDAVILQDFFDEPFSRRDILLAGVSANTRLLVGKQRPADGLNLWSPSAVGGANVASELLQLSAFATIETRWRDRFSTVASLSTQYADFAISLPAEAERAQAAGLGPLLDAESGDSTHIDWSLGANFELGNGTILYAHYQEGTSIDPTQGGAIFGEQNFGENMLMEIGLKSSLLDDSLLGALATHTWEQVAFTDRSGASENLEGEGIELEFSLQATENLMFIGSYTWQEVRRINAPEFRTMPAPEGVAEDAYMALNAGTLLLGDFGFDNTRANTDYVYPGAPQDVAKLFVIYHFPIGFSVSGGPIWQDNFYLNMDNTIELPSALIWNFSATYATDIFQLRVSVENAFSEDYYLGADPLFSANTLVTRAAPASYSLTLTINL